MATTRVSAAGYLRWSTGAPPRENDRSTSSRQLTVQSASSFTLLKSRTQQSSCIARFDERCVSLNCPRRIRAVSSSIRQGVVARAFFG